ncbi:MAG TPA: tetratricopeptide repeat protein [Novosphingobium sp.]|nr:tetratricopeptide repeat protein [Novosphingobium sp.]
MALIDRARAALVAGDGIAAEARLREAVRAGVAREAVAALMGEAQLDQGDLASARKWLGPARFSPQTRAHGFRMLGRLEQREGRFEAAARAYDAALQAAPNSIQVWTDIGRLRFAGGEQREAIEASEHALALAPGDGGALALRAVLVRSQFGPVPALPWFEAALRQAPDDPEVLAEYAATLGDVGRAGAMLEAARRLHDIAPKDPRVFYLQAVLAARAGKDALARRILDRAGDRLRDVPAAILLGGVLDLRVGNVNLAVEQFDRLTRMQPDNPIAQRLLERALSRTGDAAGVRRLAHGKPFPALSTAPSWDPSRGPAAAAPYLRALLGAGREAEAARIADRLRDEHPGSPDAKLMAGDVAFHAGRTSEALAAYDAAARIRFGEREALRLDAALRTLGREREANAVLLSQALKNPMAREPARRLAASRQRAR